MFEFLESRRLMSASLQPATDLLPGGDGPDDTLYIEGTGGPDVITAFRIGDHFVVGFGGNGIAYPSATYSRVEIRGNGGNDVIDVSDANLEQTFTIFGGHGYDTIYGSPNDDVIFGGDNTKRFIVEGADDEIHGNGGNDLLCASYRGLHSTIFGDAGDDWIVGSTGRDVLHGGSGEDAIWGLGNDDFIYGGDDDDLIFAGDGNDHVLGEDGDDTLYGDAGNDVLMGGDDEDVLHGGDGNDSLFGDEDDDVLYGEAGVDTLDGGPGDDDNNQ